MIDPITFVFKFFIENWWLIFPSILISIWWEKYKGDKKGKFIKENLSWSFFEIIFPSKVTRTPRAMEEVLNNLHAIAVDPKSTWTWWKKNIEGFVPKNYTFLIIGNNEKLRFFIRFPSELKEFIESRFYTQYPDIKFMPCTDPLEIFPSQTPNIFLDYESFSVSLNKDDVYPIRTYTEIEKLPPGQQIDPITTFLEVSHHISNKEWLIFQIFLLPVKGDDPENGKNWFERCKKEIDKITGKPAPPPPFSFIKESLNTFKNIISDYVNVIRSDILKISSPEVKKEEKEEKKEKEFDITKLLPTEKLALESVHKKMGKPGFLCSIRISYITYNEIFKNKKERISTLVESIFKTFTTEEINGFSLHNLTTKKERKKYFSLDYADILAFKSKDFSDFKKYKLPDKDFFGINKDLKFVLNSEEVATIFHPPMEFVPPTGIGRVPVREIVPPSEIPSIET